MHAETDDSLMRRALELKPRLVAIRRDIHRHPEIGYDVHRTAAIAATFMKKLGMDLRLGVGVSGVVGLLRGNSP